MLRKYDYSESSQILRLLTRGSGMLSVLAKGSKKPKSTFGGALDLFYLGRALVLRRPSSGLSLLTAFHVTESHPGLRTNLSRLYAAEHLSEILTGMTQEEEPHPELFDLVTGTIGLLATADESDVTPLLCSAELKVLSELGFAPSLDICASCGKKAEPPGIALSVTAGGVLCAECRNREPGRTDVTPGLLSGLRALAETPVTRATRVRIGPADARRIRSFLTAFEEWRLERRLRAAQFL